MHIAVITATDSQIPQPLHGKNLASSHASALPISKY